MNHNFSHQRYQRQISLQDFGESAQQKLQQAKVLVVGAGGLGCPALQYLAAAGVGNIGIADGDTIALSNLQRQVLYNTNEIGLYKAVVAAEKLRQLNPDINIEAHVLYVDVHNALALIAAYDIIIDGTDNFSTRYMINDACTILNKPLVFGAVYQYEGQISIFNVADDNAEAINYRHLFPVPPNVEEAPDCATAGVLGTIPGTIGIMQATETIKFITGIGVTLANKMFTYNALTNESLILDVTGAFKPVTNAPQNEIEFLQMDYPGFCNSKKTIVKQIDAQTFKEMISDESIMIIDVREVTEKPLPNFRHLQIPLSIFDENIATIHSDTVVIFCQSGVRSLAAAEKLISFAPQKNIYNLRGGILSL